MLSLSDLIYPLDAIRLNISSKFNRDAPSLLWIEVLLSKVEIKILLQLLFRTSIEKDSIHEKLRKLTLIIYWPPTPNETEEPEFILARFDNGFTIWKRGITHNIGYFASIPDDVEQLHTLISNTRSIYGDAENAFYSSHGFTFDKILERDEFHSLLSTNQNVSEFLLAGGTNLAIPYNYAGISYNPSNPQNYVVEIFDFCRLQKTSKGNITLWHFIRYIIARSIVILREIRPSYERLGEILLKLRNQYGYQTQHQQLKATFSDIFPNVGFDVFEKPGVSNGPIIMIHEGEKEYNLLESAAGYFEVLNILSSLSAIESDSILVIDEPALHLHPLRIRYFGKKMASFANRQVILFTHSPYLVNISLFGTNQCLIKVQKDAKGSSKILDKQREKEFTFSIKAYHFKPDIFFSRCNVFVEGASDVNALMAISDALRNVFEVNDILLVDSGGKDNLDKYIGLIELYELPHVAMADRDYILESRKITADFTILPGRLEDELAKLDSGSPTNTAVKNTNVTKCSNNKTKSIDATRAYELVYNKMNTDRKKVKDTNLGLVFNQALVKVGITNLEEIWNTDSG